MIREGFVFYRSYYEAIKNLPSDDFKECAVAMMEYGLDGKVPETENPFAKLVFDLTKPQFDANNKRAENGRKGGAYGYLGGAPKGNNNAKKKQPQDNPETTPKQPQDSPETTPKEKDKEKDKDKDKGLFLLENPKRVFTPPTVQEVEAYIREKGYHVNADKFVDFYQSKGWYVGKNKMKDWKASLRTWERTDKSKPESNNNFRNFKQTDYDFEALEREAGIR